MFADKECQICMFENIQNVLPCAHAFCNGCINDWLKKSDKCPMCRETVKTRLTRSMNKSFFEIIDLDGKDDVIDGMEAQVENIVNQAIDCILNLPEFNIRAEIINNNNEHIKVTDIKHYSQVAINIDDIKNQVNPYQQKQKVTFEPIPMGRQRDRGGAVYKKKEMRLEKVPAFKNSHKVVEEDDYNDLVMETQRSLSMHKGDSTKFDEMFGNMIEKNDDKNSMDDLLNNEEDNRINIQNQQH